MKDVFDAPAILLMGSDPTYQHPLLAWQIRNNVRLHHARLYLINSRAIKLTRQATCFARVDEGREGWAVAFLAGDDSACDKCSTNSADHNNLVALREKLSTEKNVLVVCGPELHGEDIAGLVRATTALTPGCKWVCLGDYANSRGASDMGLYPDLLPGYTPVWEGDEFRDKWDAQLPAEPGLNLVQILEGSKNGLLKALYVVGSNPVARYHVDPFVLRATFLVVQDLFLTETAQLADVVLPAASAYEKSGTLIAFSSRSRSGRRPQCVVRKPQACESLGSDRRHIRSGCRPENLAGGTRAGVPHVAMHVLLSVYGGLSTIHRWYGFCGRCHY
jgi:NADH-quinone oxidoreductase subunit G